MANKYIILKTALICSVFSTSLLANEDQQDFVTPYLMGQSKTLEATVPQRSMLSEFGHQFKEDITTKTKQGFSHYVDLGKKILQDRDFGPLIVDLLEKHLISANQKLVGEFFKPKNSLTKDEFDIEALRPLVEIIRNKLCDLIGEVFLKRNLVGYLPDGKAIKIYENRTVFSLLLDAFIPDLMPAKKLIIKVADIGPVRNYLMDKFDEMIIRGILSLYQKTTGKMVKQSVSDLVGKLTAKSRVMDHVGDGESSIDHKEMKAISSSQTVDEEMTREEVEQEGSYVWEFLQPRLTHYLRFALCDVIKPGVEELVKDLGHYGQRKLLPSTSELNQYTIWGALGYASLGYVGVPLFMVGNFAKNTAFESVLKTLRHRMVDYLDLYVKYYTYNLIEYTPAEHYLYGLNSDPTQLERAILAKDYEAQEKIRERGLIGAIIKDLAKRSWVGRLITNPEEIDEIRSTSTQALEAKNSLAIQITLGEIADKKKRGEKLTSEQERLLENLLTYPSYGIKGQEIDLVTLWGKGDKGLTSKAKKVRHDQGHAESHLIDIYQLYGQKIPGEFASVYQQLECWSGQDSDKFIVDWIDVQEAIAKSLLENIGSFSSVDLDLFKEAVDKEEFLEDYVKQFVVSHDISQKPSLKYKEAQSVLRDPKLLKDLPAAYSHYKYQSYIDENQKTISLLQQSPLCFGLSEADVIDLHMHMTGKQLRQFAAEELSYEDSIKAVGVQDFDHPIVQAVHTELETIARTIDRVVQDDLHMILQHYAKTFIQGVDIPAFIKKVEFPSDIQKQANAIDFDAKGYQVIKTYYNNVDEEILRVAVAKADFIKKEFLDRPEAWPIFREFREDLRNFVQNGRLRSDIYQHIYSYILDQLIAMSNDSLHDFVVVSEEMGESKEKIKISPYQDLSIYDKSDFAGFYVSNLVNQLVKEGALQDVTSLSKDDIIRIHQEIQKFKKKRCMEADGCLFADDHLGQLIQFKSTLPEYEGKLFYGYSEITDQIMTANHKILETIRKQPKKES